MNRKKKTRYMPVLLILAVFVLITLALIGQNFQRARGQTEPAIALLQEDAFAGREEAGLMALSPQPGQIYECLYLWDSEDGNSMIFHEQMPRILQDMRVTYIETDIRKEQAPDLREYGFEKVVIGFADYECGRETLEKIMEWVRDGGEVLIALIPETSNISNWMSQMTGIEEEGRQFYETDKVRIKDSFMLTGEKKSYAIEDPFHSSRLVALSDECSVYMESDDPSQVPLLWEKGYGKGKLVVVNLGIYEKAYRGFYGAAYSLLGPVCAYPVINGSVFFIDDFPPPFFETANAPVLEEYQMNAENFYSRIWWDSMNALAEKYGFSYTAAILENYGDVQQAPFEANENRWQYQYFGNMLLKAGGEVGLHGYNHMPLSLDNTDYEDSYPDYRAWRSAEDMRASIEALQEFCRELFPEERFQLYVPPSNILSEEGREMLAGFFPEIRSIAGSYFPREGADGQEFEVTKEGMIDTPRITFGYEVEGDNRIAALSELNLHFVNTHCQYPDRVLSAGADESLKWEEMLEKYTEYVDWLYGAAPGIRSMTGSELAAAVQRFYYLGIQKQETEESLILTLGQFQDEAWLMLRFNRFEPDASKVEGGTLKKLEGNLYLLRAEKEQIKIGKQKG